MTTRNLILAAGVLAVGGLVAAYAHLQAPGRDPIRVGILHSQSGTMAGSEKPVADATLLAIEEINRAGGVLGRPVQPVLADGASDEQTFAREANRLIVLDGVCTVFGCWTSASRKAVKPVVERHDSLLVYPVQYEGVEQSPNIIYTGAAPNQQIIPAVTWSFNHLGKRFFLVGSDYVFPRVAHAIIKDHAGRLGATVVGEAYLPLGSHDVHPVVEAIRAAKPDVILNTINGDSNLHFYRALRRAGVTPERVPTMSFSIAEQELGTLDPADVAGDYLTWNYFQSVPGEENRRFVEGFRRRFGADRVTADPIEAGYFGVHLWAQAVADAGAADARAIRKAIKRQSLHAPGGMVYVDPETQHTWKAVRVGRIRRDGQVDILWNSERPIRPSPYPGSRSRDDWDRLLSDLYDGWGGRWAAPSASQTDTPAGDHAR